MWEMSRKRILVLVGLIGACILLMVGYNDRSIKKVYLQGMISVAHRGASGFAPENTQSSFRKGVELNADFLECDVHLSKDGELIIMHDDKVDRTTNGSGYIKDFTLAELKELDAGQSFDSAFTGEQIMTLDELLEEFYGEVGMLIEIKNPITYPGIEEKVAELLHRYDDLDSIIVQSFDIESMRKVHKLIPEIQIAILMRPNALKPSSNKIEDLTSFATYINFNVGYVNKRVVDTVHQHGGKVLVWSKKDRQLIAKAVQYGVDGVITDFAQWPVDNPVYLARE